MFSAAFIGTISSHLWSQIIIMMLTSFIYWGGSHCYGQIRDSLRFWCGQGFLRWSGAIGFTCDVFSFNQLLHILFLTPTSPFVFGVQSFFLIYHFDRISVQLWVLFPPPPFKHRGTSLLWAFCDLCRALLASQPATPLSFFRFWTLKLRSRFQM